MCRDVVVIVVVVVEAVCRSPVFVGLGVVLLFKHAKIIGEQRRGVSRSMGNFTRSPVLMFMQHIGVGEKLREQVAP